MVSDVDADRVRLMGRLLAQQPRPVQPVAFSDVLASRAVTPAGQLWREVARHASIAGTTGMAPTAPLVPAVTGAGPSFAGLRRWLRRPRCWMVT